MYTLYVRKFQLAFRAKTLHRYWFETDIINGQPFDWIVDVERSSRNGGISLGERFKLVFDEAKRTNQDILAIQRKIKRLAEIAERNGDEKVPVDEWLVTIKRSLVA